MNNGAAEKRDYCESCGYTDSHDPNCPRPRGVTSGTLGGAHEPPMVHVQPTVAGVPLGACPPVSEMPCPFCGSSYASKIAVKFGDKKQYDGFRLQCPLCDAQTGIGLTDEILKRYWERRTSPGVSELVEHLRSQTGEIERLKEALRQCKAFVVGERSPNWHDDAMTYLTRGKIADVCDIALAYPQHPRDLHLSPEARGAANRQESKT